MLIQFRLKLILFIWMLSCGLAHGLPLSIQGATTEVEDNLRLHLSRWSQLPANSVEEVRRIIQPALREALNALGYYDYNAKYELKGDVLHLDLQLGLPLTWGAIQITVNDMDSQPVLAEFIQQHPFVKGEKISHGVYENFKKNLLLQANNLGYLDAELKKKNLQLRPADKRADVVMDLWLGERYQIDSVEFRKTVLAPAYLERLAEVPVGSWFSADTVGDVYNRLLNTGYFSAVVIDVEKQPPNSTQLIVELTDLPEYSFSTGVGFSTNSLVRGSVRWTIPRIGEIGDSLTSAIQLSKVEQSATSQYKYPLQHPQNEYLSVDLGWRRRDVEEVEVEKFTVGLAYNKNVSNAFQYSYRVDVDSEKSQRDNDNRITDTYVVPGVRASYRQQSGPVNDPSQGYHLWGSFAVSADQLGSDTNFTRINLGANAVFTWSEKHSVLTRFEWGKINNDNFLEVPVSQRFVTGGDQSIRGFKFDSISALDSQNNVIGGEELAVASIEYRYEFIENWKGVVFVDSGRAGVDANTERLDREGLPFLDDGRELRTGAGIGVRWKSPVGLIAADVAAPINDERENSTRLHFYFSTTL